MIDPQRKQKVFFNRAQHQIRDIELTCREVITFSKQLNLTANGVDSSEVACRKMEIIKTEIRDKLREFALNIDEVYKILDRKIVLIINEITKEQNSAQSRKLDRMETLNNSLIQKERYKQKETDRNSNCGQDKICSDTLNPRINFLQAKISEHQKNEVVLHEKIKELKSKNQKLLEQFNRLSTASNKKINELHQQLSNKTRNYSYQNEVIQNKTGQNSPVKIKRQNNLYYDDQQPSYQQYEPSYSSDSYQKEQRTKLLNFGCMPPKVSQEKNILGLNLSNDCERLDKNDRNRRFDILLNKLRDSQQESTEGSNCEEFKAIPQQPGSVFSENIIRRYHI